MSFRLSSKLNVIVLILLLSIGFAAVATNLIINGNTRISSNPADFDVYFIEASTNPGGEAYIVDEGRGIEWNSHMLTNPGEIAYLDYTVYNNSVNYDANVLIALNVEDVVNHVDYSGYYTIRTTTFDSTGYTVVHGKEAVDGKIEVELVKPIPENVSISFNMSMSGSPIARDATVGPARTPCNVVTGNGHEFGNEITCAGEEFYVLDNEQGAIHMLSKYNLLAGNAIDNIVVSQERFDELVSKYEKNNPNSTQYIDEEILLEDEFSLYAELYNIGGNYCSISKQEADHSFKVNIQFKPDGIHQNPHAIGAHGDELGNPDPQQIGIFSDQAARCFSLSDFDTEEEYENSLYGGGAFCDATTIYEGVHEAYKQYLEDNHVVVSDVNSITLNELSNIVRFKTGNPIPLEDWGESTNYIGEGTSRIYILGSLKELISEDYKWLYSTTYWTRTGFAAGSAAGSDFTVFVDTLGIVCSKYGCHKAIGAGIRPIVTIFDFNVDYSTAPEVYVGR